METNPDQRYYVEPRAASKQNSYTPRTTRSERTTGGVPYRGAPSHDVPGAAGTMRKSPDSDARETNARSVAC